jgi:RHS repeat-associated protein
VDRLGSNVSNGKRYYPYGIERPSATANELEKFTSYFRDAETGLDSADQRYEEPGYGRFITPDRTGGAAVQSPLSFNAYSYLGGDPVNRVDPTGSDWCEVPGNYYPPYSGPCNGSGPNGICWTIDLVATGPDCSIVNLVDYELIADLIGLGGGPAGGEGGGGSGGSTGCPADAFLGTNGCVHKVPVRPVQNRFPTEDQCTVSLYDRPAGIDGNPGLHTYTYVDDPFLTNLGYFSEREVIEGGPENGLLTGRVSPGTVASPASPLGGPGTTSDPSASNNGRLGSYNGFGSCRDVETILRNEGRYNAGGKVPYYYLPSGPPPAGTGTYNSNSFTFTLLSDVLLQGLLGRNVGGVYFPGWGFLVPGL